MNQQDCYFDEDDLDGYQEGTSFKGKDALKIFMESVKSFPTLTREENDELLRKYQVSSEEEKNVIRDQIVEGNIRLVISSAFRIAGLFKNTSGQRNNGLIMDFIQEGSEGLSRAVEDYDPSRGNAFSTVATTYITRAIYGFLNDDFNQIRIPHQIMEKQRLIQRTETELSNRLGRKPTEEEIAEALPSSSKMKADEINSVKAFSQMNQIMPLDGMTEDGKPDKASMIPSDDMTPQEYSQRNELEEKLRDAIQTLTPTMQYILKHRYPTDGTTVWTLSKLGDELNLSLERVRQIEQEAIGILREKLK